MAKRSVRKRKGRKPAEASPQPRWEPDPEKADPTRQLTVSNTQKAVRELRNPYTWRRYRGPLDGHHTPAGLHPLDELIHVPTMTRVCYLIDHMPERWPELVTAIKQAGLDPPEGLAAAREGKLRVVTAHRP